MHEHELELFQVGDTVWITVKNISVRVVMSSEGAVCDMYTLNKRWTLDEAYLASCYAFFSEAEEQEEKKDED